MAVSIYQSRHSCLRRPGCSEVQSLSACGCLRFVRSRAASSSSSASSTGRSHGGPLENHWIWGLVRAGAAMSRGSTHGWTSGRLPLRLLSTKPWNMPMCPMRKSKRERGAWFEKQTKTCCRSHGSSPPSLRCPMVTRSAGRLPSSASMASTLQTFGSSSPMTPWCGSGQWFDLTEMLRSGAAPVSARRQNHPPKKNHPPRRIRQQHPQRRQILRRDLSLPSDVFWSPWVLPNRDAHESRTQPVWGNFLRTLQSPLQSACRLKHRRDLRCRALVLWRWKTTECSPLLTCAFFGRIVNHAFFKWYHYLHENVSKYWAPETIEPLIET